MTRNTDPAVRSENGCLVVISSDRRQFRAETSSKTLQALDTCEAVEDHEVELGQQCVPGQLALRLLRRLHEILGAGEESPASGLHQRQASCSGQLGSRRWRKEIPFRHTFSLRRTTTSSERCRRPSRDPLDPRPVSTPFDPTHLGCSRFSTVIEALRVGAGRTAAFLASKALACPRGPWRHDSYCQSPSATPSLRAFARRAR